MRPVLAAAVAAAFLAGPALAQTTVTGKQAPPDAKSSQTSGGQEAVTRPNTDKLNANGTGSVGEVRLEPGANSFTDGEAASRLAKAGFANARDLRKDQDGIWRCTATRDGKDVKVGLDFKGNVAVQ